MSELAIEKLESKIAFMERHIEQQDRVILELRNSLDETQNQIEGLKEALQDMHFPRTDVVDEKPPHY
jgi:uncharacterized coiled-coil protein SlyX